MQSNRPARMKGSRSFLPWYLRPHLGQPNIWTRIQTALPFSPRRSKQRAKAGVLRPHGRSARIEQHPSLRKFPTQQDLEVSHSTRLGSFLDNKTFNSATAM